MARKHTYYLPLDEDFWHDPEVQMFRREKGKSAVLDYLMILTFMRDYQRTDYMIPFAYLPMLAYELDEEQEELRGTINYCIKIGFFEVFTDEIEKTKFFFSRRRQNDLRAWQLYTEKCSQAGKKGNDMRWNNRDKENKDENN